MMFSSNQIAKTNVCPFRLIPNRFPLQARQEILSVYTQRMPLAEGVCLEDLADATHMYTGADLEGLCREVTIIAFRHN